MPFTATRSLGVKLTAKDNVVLHYFSLRLSEFVLLFCTVSTWEMGGEERRREMSI